ncbi:MAG: DNA-directed RNA polymerase subunit beta' [Candidatus Pacebacteria bacterium]|nr:DNA-directed RNA polymerase subunit beta' [Candidatus Paceibacterota bacterium]
MTNIGTKVEDFEAVRLKLASPEEILSWSCGEVLKPETINYRTQRPEKDGLFCEKIFGPTKDWECYCGKYKRIRYKGIVCDKCGVEVTKSIVRRERMGYIKLAVPISHVWFLRGVPSSIGLALNMSIQELERIIYFASYLIINVNEEERKAVSEQIEAEYKSKIKNGKKTLIIPEINDIKEARDKAKEELRSIKKLKVISEVEYRNLSLKYASVFKADIGTEAIKKALYDIDLKSLIKKLEKEIAELPKTSAQRKKIMKRLRLVRGFVQAGIKPEWMCLMVVPVIPPDLRPMVQLDGGRFATSDLNDLYRRVINRNNRLKKLIELGAPEVISRNEKRMLQEAVDALIDNSARRGQATMAATGKRRQLRSLADMLKGKQGRFRQNLLGKRVDYSARSVIVIGPNLRLDQCGLPKKMALELFKPFVMKELIERSLAYNVRSANKLIEQGITEVWDILEEVIKNKAVLLNRAPTLHRLGIQAFYPTLIEGKAIQIHPMVCKAFNADFDGDQMAVHLPLTEEAQKESREIMLSSKNLLKPATGEPIVVPSQDIVLGCYYMTKIVDEEKEKEKEKAFNSFEEAVISYKLGLINLRAKIKLRNNSWVKAEKSVSGARSGVSDRAEKFIETSVGRIIFNQSLPEELVFINKVMDSGALKNLIADALDVIGEEGTVRLIDKIKSLGFKYATKSGLSWGMDDVKIPDIKKELLKNGDGKIDEIRDQYEEGLLTENERRIKSIEVWNDIKSRIAQEIPNTIGEESPVAYMINSGARSNWAVITQMGGMKGLVVNPSGETIELPIKSSFKEGFNVLEYFISTHGTRKGMADTALRTSTAGYLTRRLVDVAQDVIIHEKNCHDTEGTEVIASEHLDIGRTVSMRLRGRTALKDIKNPKTKKVIVKADDQISKEDAEKIEKAGIERVWVRSIVNCKAKRGICQACYGYDLGKNKLVEIGQAVGIVTAQAIGEPGTQLTMRTFHSGGVAGKDITQGLPRVEEIFEARLPKGKAVISEVNGIVEDIEETQDSRVIHIKFKPKMEEAVEKEKIEDVQSYVIDKDISILVKKGELITAGQQLVEGHVDIHELFELKEIKEVQRYIIKEVQQVYTSQGEGIDDKHIEIIIRQMLSRVRIKDMGDTNLLIGDIVEKAQLTEANNRIKAENRENKNVTDKIKNPAVAEQLLLGITKASLTTESFLSAASFQETARVLIGAAITGKEDKLRGLKENVIIGRLIPSGTGYFRNIDKEE